MLDSIKSNRKLTATSAGSAMLVIVLAFTVSACSEPATVDYEKSAQLTVPVAVEGFQEVKAEPAVVAGNRSGEMVANKYCAACHGSGALGAPKIGDAAAWRPRITEGMPTLLKHAINGLNSMPPRGGAPDLTDTELERAIVFMADKDGAHFVSPPVK